MYNTKVFIGMYDDGHFDQEIYGEVDKMCAIVEYLIGETYKLVYFGAGGDTARKQKVSSDVAETMVRNGILKAINDIDKGVGSTVEIE